MAAKWYRRQDRPDRLVVYLNWRGKAFKRGWWDDVLPILHEDMAIRLCGQINDEISKLGRHFNPSKWFSRGQLLTVPVYAGAWLDRQTHLSNNSFPKASRTVSLVKEFPDWQDLPISMVKAGHIDDFAAWVKGAPKTRKDYLGWLHKMFSDAYKREDIARIPPFPSINVPETEIQWIPREWQDKIISLIPEPDRSPVQFLRFFGCRVGEARALKWDAVDFEASGNAPWGRVIFKRGFSWDVLKEYTKTRRIRTLPMDQPTRELMLVLRGKATVFSIDGFVFLNKKGRPYGKNELTTIWNCALNEASCPKKVTLYQGTRHSRGTQWIDDGKSIELVREWLGHTRDDMTRRYARATGKGLGSLVDNES